VKKLAAALLLIVVTGALLVAAYPLLRHPLLLAALWHARPATTLPVPVDGVRRNQLTDSWGSPRPGGRHHEGMDIFAKRGTPIRSTTRGIIVNVGENRLGGHVVKVLGPGLEWHYYAHMDHFADVHVGDAVRAGEVLGYVGDSGDAAGTPTHLHYGIYRRLGGAVDPYRGSGVRRPRRRGDSGGMATAVHVNAGSAARR
jgi:peptidoglycan LD-endopeptidase LytH